MRSRYSAFAKSRIDWLQATTWPPNRKHFDLEGYRDRANDSLWLGLEILEITDGSPQDTKGTVTFLARSMVGGKLTEQREKSLFRKKQDRWYYVKPIS